MNRTHVQVWVCAPGSGAAPLNSTALNLTEALAATADPRTAPPFGAGLGPLQPGPAVRINVVLSSNLSAAALADLQRSLCGVVWDLSDPSDADRCEWQLWVDLQAGANGEVWDDSARQWTASGDGYLAAPGDGGAGFWTASVTALMESNGNASRARARITSEVNSAGFRSAHHVAAKPGVTVSGDGGARTGGLQYFAHVDAPSPAAKRGAGSPLGCSSHYECMAGYFCSNYAMQQILINSQAACDLCETCFYSDQYPIDGACPQDRCGPRAGTFPRLFPPAPPPPSKYDD